MLAPKKCLQSGFLLAATMLSARAGTFNNDFNSGTTPPGTAVYGNAVVEATGGVGDSGVLKLTKAINGQSGSFVIDDIDSGNPIYGFDVNYDVLIGGGSSTPADGMSFCFAPDLPNGTWGEEGTGSGLCFNWDIYDNGNETPLAPDIDVSVMGAKVATRKQTIATITTNAFVHVHIRVNADGSLNFDYRGQTLLTNFFLPNYQLLVNAAVPGRFGFGARTGGLNANQWVDNLSITTFLQPLVGISQQPLSETVLQGDNAIFDVRVGNTNGATYQWLSNNVAIAGATSQTLVITNVQPGASGSQYKVTITGPNNSVTSTVATLTVGTLTLPGSPQLSYNFDDGLVPAGTAVFGTAFVDTTGGSNNSGALKLTVAANNQFGAWVVSDINAGAPVYAFTARFQLLAGGGTTPPADGFAFAFGNDIPADPTATSPQYEEGQGLGTGLVVNMDIYNNDTIFGLSNPFEQQPAPSIDVRFGGVLIATAPLPLSFLDTGDQYGDTIIQMNTDATLSVVYRGAIVFNHLPVPAFGSIAGGSFALAARTGGLNENFWVDNFQLTTITNSGAVRITTQPASRLVLINHSATLSVGVNDTNGVAYQWARNGSAISGATSNSYTLASAQLADSGVPFTVVLTKGLTTITSTPAILTVVNLTGPSSPQFSFNFNDGLVPPGTGVYGNSSVTPNGGVGDSGVLHLTDAFNSQNGAFVVSNLVFNGAQVNSIGVSFDLREGGGSGTPADGWSFNWAAGLPDAVVGNAETGTGNGFSLCFRVYIGNGNADNPPSPYIAIKYKGAIIASTQIPASQLETGSDYRTMLLRIDPDGKVYLAYGERVLYNGLQLPNYTFIANSKFGFYGRTGGLNENQWFDNIQIRATQSTGPMTVTSQPADALVIVGQTATFNVGVSDPNGATYQWAKNGANISGATLSSYTTPATVIGDSGSTFKVTVTGPSGTATSSNAVLTVVTPITITSPGVVYDFNDCALPPGTTLNGSAGGGYIDCSGGVTNSGVLKLTDAINGQGGTFIIPDLDSNVPIKALTVCFQALVGGGTVPPADGFSFVWASSNDLPSNIIFGEGGAGTGLIVVFDIYNNAGEAPSFSIVWHGSTVISKLVDISLLETGTNFGNVYIRVNATGKVDVQYNGRAIFNQVQLPNYAALAGGEFALGARTGGLNENQWFDNIAIATTQGLVPIPLNFTRTGNTIRFTWGPNFKLQSTPSLSPPVTWTDVPGATSPYTTTTTGPAQFFRLAPAN